jgi:hypothetical protein
MSKGIVVNISGGMGKCIIFTAVAKCFKQQYPERELIVVSGFPEVFVNNPNVDGNYPFATPELWKRFFGNPQYKSFNHDPYLEDSWVKNEKMHLTRIWCKLLGVKCTGTDPELFFSAPEVDELNMMIQVNKPLCVVQSSGGANPASRSWTRNPNREELDAYLERYLESHYIIHLGLPETPPLNNVHQRIENLNRRQAISLIYYAHTFVGIDSYGLHARAANPLAGQTTIFLPLAESKERLGYPHKPFNWLIPVPEVQAMLESHTDFYATLFKLSIDDVGENCPVPPGIKWFEI